MTARTCLVAGAVALALSLGASRSEATPLVNFTISDLGPGAVFTETFTLPLAPAIAFGSLGSGFIPLPNPTPVVVNGKPKMHTFIFYNAANSIGLLAKDTIGLFGIAGTGQVYSGRGGSPTFIPGVYTGVNVDTGDTATITIAETPLPSSWAMMLGGLAAAGFLAYRGTRKTATSISAA